MKREDFFTGEPVEDGSPPFSQNYISENEAIQNASFGKYDYDPGNRIMSQPVNVFPGGYGYSTSPNGYNGYYPNQPQVGLGANPYQYGYYNPQSSYYYQQTQQQTPQEITFYVQPVNFSGEYLPSMGFEEEIEQMKRDYWTRSLEKSAEDSVNRQQQNFGYYGGYYNGNNYYGTPFYNPYQYNSLDSEISRRAQEMEDEARENRKRFNLNIARLAHNIAGDTYNDDELVERYEGKTVSAPYGFTNYSDMYEYNRFSNLVPFDNSQYYREFNASVSREYNSIIPENSSMNDCFENMGILNAHYELEEEKHRRRNGTLLYDDNSYKYYVKAKAAERYAEKNGIQINNMAQQPQQPYANNVQDLKQEVINSMPTLSQSATLCDDGTLNITCNFGSKAGQVYSVHNSQEAEYEEDRARFKAFVDSIPGSIYLNNPNPNSGGGESG